MEPINYRNVTEQDYPQVSEMLCGIWQFDKYLKDAEIVRRAGLAFWYAYLARQNYAEVAERGGQDPRRVARALRFPSLSRGTQGL